MRLLRLLASALIFLVFASTSFAATKYYIVQENSTNIKHSTTSFADAKSSGTSTTLNNFFSGASPALADNDEIYIAKGTYTLTGTLTTNGSTIDKALKIYGGFSGEETSINLETRDIANNATVLTINTANSVIHCKANATIDGFTIQGGNGN